MSLCAHCLRQGCSSIVSPQYIRGPVPRRSQSLVFAHQEHRKTCQHCLETDHLSSKCALAPVKVDRASSWDCTRNDAQTSRSRGEQGEQRGCGNKICFSWNDGCCASPTVNTAASVQSVQGSTRWSTARRTHRWNWPPSHQREWGRSRWCNADSWGIVVLSTV